MEQEAANENGTRTCSVCGESFTQWHRNGDGRICGSICRDCHNAKRRTWYQANKYKERNRRKEYYYAYLSALRRNLVSDLGLNYMRRELVYEVFDEVRRQDEKWGQQLHDPFVWLAILNEEIGEFAEAVLKTWGVEDNKPKHNARLASRQELIQVIAVSLQILWSLDLQKYWTE